MKKTVVIINFNTPEMCEAAIMSLRKHGGKDYRVIVFDNSTDVDYPATGQMEAMKMCARPFTRKMEGVEIIDNTKGQVIDIDAELAKYPNRNSLSVNSNNSGSVRHIITIQA
jgi:GT2 family glycosyltransferase